MFTCDIPLALIFYILLRPVNANLALLAAFFRFAEAIIGHAPKPRFPLDKTIRL
jgi:Domain of unknown function (DUF4386)